MEHDEILLKDVIEISLFAGKKIIDIYRKDFSIEYKNDKSPLTEADILSNELITSGLTNLDSQYPILSEENRIIDYSERKNWKRFWLVDPIDGTKEFIKKNGEFTINIALIDQGEPVMGVVYAPALETLYYGMKGFGSYRKTNGKTEKLPLAQNNPSESKVIRIAASRSHMNKDTSDFIDKVSAIYPDCIIENTYKGSSLKLCMVAEGSADIYPRAAPTMEWDTAAAHGIVEASGRGVFRFDTFNMNDIRFNSEIHAEKLTYNKTNLLNPNFIVI